MRIANLSGRLVRWLADGDELVSAIEGNGELGQRFTA